VISAHPHRDRSEKPSTTCPSIRSRSYQGYNLRTCGKRSDRFNRGSHPGSLLLAFLKVSHRFDFTRMAIFLAYSTTIVNGPKDPIRGAHRARGHYYPSNSGPGEFGLSLSQLLCFWRERLRKVSVKRARRRLGALKSMAVSEGAATPMEDRQPLVVSIYSSESFSIK